MDQEKKFFDIPGYFKGEIDSIKANFSTVSKTAVYNGDTNRQVLKVVDVNWEKEFALFLESDINKPAYYANMRLIHFPRPDGSIPENELFYMADSKELKVQSVEIRKDTNGVSWIKIIISKSNLVSVTNIEAHYKSKRSYLIKGEQKIKNLGDKNTFFVEGKFND